LLDTSNINDNNKLRVEFTRPLEVNDNTIKRIQTFAYAYSSKPPESSDVDAYLYAHDYKGNVELKLHGDASSEIVWSRYDKLIIAHGMHHVSLDDFLCIM